MLANAHGGEIFVIHLVWTPQNEKEYATTPKRTVPHRLCARTQEITILNIYEGEVVVKTP